MKKLASRNSSAPHISTRIPVGYDKKFIRVLPCNPTLAYVYWEIPFSIKHEHDTLQLRVSTLEDPASPGEIISIAEVASEKHSAYIETSAAGTVHFIELGTKNADGSFATISSTTFMPSTQSDETELSPPDFGEIDDTADTDDNTTPPQPEKVHNTEEKRPSIKPTPRQEARQQIFPNPSSWINK